MVTNRLPKRLHIPHLLNESEYYTTTKNMSTISKRQNRFKNTSFIYLLNSPHSKLKSVAFTGIRANYFHIITYYIKKPTTSKSFGENT